MKKYKKYVKTEHNSEQSNKSSLNDSKNNNNKTPSNNTEFNNKNDSNNNKNKNKLKKEENSDDILLEIIDAAISFFTKCKDFLIPNEIPVKIFLFFLILEILYQGITIYLIKSVNHLLAEFFSIWNNFIYIYIYIIGGVQMVYIFICEGLLIFRFIYGKIYLYKKFNWLINILSLIIIIFNLFEIKDLNYKVHRFYTKNLDNLANKNKIIKKYKVNEYINLHINKNEDFQRYEFCYELKTDINNINQIKDQFPNIKWSYNTYTDIHTGCRNLTLENESLSEIDSNNFFFKCENKIDINTASNVCVSSKYRQKRFYAQIKMAFYELLILIMWNLYNVFSIRIIYKYYPELKNDNNSEYENYPRKNQINHTNKIQNQTITFKDINDKEIKNIENNEEEEEDENEFEEEDEESIKKEEKIQKEGYVKVFKMRRISKRKMKTYKKKNKKRYKEENLKNKNIYFDDDILNLNYFDNKFEKDEDSINNDEEKEETYFIKNNKYNELIENKKKKLNNKEKNKEKSDSDSNDDDNEKSEEEESNELNDDEQAEETEEDEEYNNMEQIHMLYSKKKKTFENIEKFQWFRRLWNFLSERYVSIFKNKIRNILLKIDKSIKEN